MSPEWIVVTIVLSALCFLVGIIFGIIQARSSRPIKVEPAKPIKVVIINKESDESE